MLDVLHVPLILRTLWWKRPSFIAVVYNSSDGNTCYLWMTNYIHKSPLWSNVNECLVFEKSNAHWDRILRAIACRERSFVTRWKAIFRQYPMHRCSLCQSESLPTITYRCHNSTNTIYCHLVLFMNIAKILLLTWR